MTQYLIGAAVALVAAAVIGRIAYNLTPRRRRGREFRRALGWKGRRLHRQARRRERQFQRSRPAS